MCKIEEMIMVDNSFNSNNSTSSISSSDYSEDESSSIMDSTYDTKLAKIIKDINEANTKSEKLYSIGAAIEIFDHSNIMKHNKEIQEGALNALYNQLLQEIEIDDDSFYVEQLDYELIADICFTITYLLRCSNDVKINLFDDTNIDIDIENYNNNDHDIGFDLVMTLIQIVQNCLDNNNAYHHRHQLSSSNNNNNISRIIYYPMKVLHILSRVDIISQKFANCEELLSLIVSLLGSDKGKNGSNNNNIDINVKIETMLVLKNIIHHSNNDDYKFSLLQYPSLLHTLVYNIYSSTYFGCVGGSVTGDNIIIDDDNNIEIYNNDITDNDYYYQNNNHNNNIYHCNKMKEIISIIFLSFTSSSSFCRKHIMNYGIVLNAFIHLLDDNNTTTSTSSTTYRIKYNILSSLYHLSNDNKCLSFLLLHYDGIFIDVLSHIIKHNYITSTSTITSNNTDSKVRLCSKALEICRAIATTTNTSDDTIEQLLERNGFLSTLEHALLSNDTNHCVRLEVANTFFHIASYVTPTMHVTHQFTQMLLRLSGTTNISAHDTVLDNNTICVEISARAILKMTLVANNHCILIQTPGLLASLATMALSTSLSSYHNYSNNSAIVAIRENATGALFNLSCTTNMQAKESMLSNTHLLYVLVQISTYGNIENRYSRDFAVGTLVNLSCLPDARTKLVKFDGLLLSLVQFVSDTTVEHSAKESVKSSIIQLVSVI